MVVFISGFVCLKVSLQHKERQYELLLGKLLRIILHSSGVPPPRLIRERSEYLLMHCTKSNTYVSLKSANYI